MIQKNTPENADNINAPVDGKIMFSNPSIESVLLTLKPGEIIPEHTNPANVLFVGITGQATIINQQKEEIILHGCETLFVTSEEPRSMINNTEKEVKVMVVKIHG